MQGRGLSWCSRVSLCLAQRPTLRESDSLAPSLAYNISFPDSTLLFRAKQAARTNPSLFATRHPAYGISALLFVSLSLRIEYFIPDSVLPFFAQSGFASAKPARFLQRVIPPAEYPSFSLLHLRVKHLSCETFILFVIFSSSRNARHPCRPAGWDARAVSRSREMQLHYAGRLLYRCFRRGSQGAPIALSAGMYPATGCSSIPASHPGRRPCRKWSVPPSLFRIFAANIPVTNVTVPQ